MGSSDSEFSELSQSEGWCLAIGELVVCSLNGVAVFPTRPLEVLSLRQTQTREKKSMLVFTKLPCSLKICYSMSTRRILVKEEIMALQVSDKMESRSHGTKRGGAVFLTVVSAGGWILRGGPPAGQLAGHCQPSSGWRPPGPVIGAAPFLGHLEIASPDHLLKVLTGDNWRGRPTANRLARRQALLPL